MKLVERIDWARHGLPMAFIAMLIVFTLINPAFFSTRNMIQTTRQAAILFLIVSGQTFALLARGIDLSQGSVMSLVSVATISSIYVLGAFAGSVVGILFGASCGLVNGVLIGYLGIPPILTTLGMLVRRLRNRTGLHRRGDADKFNRYRSGKTFLVWWWNDRTCPCPCDFRRDHRPLAVLPPQVYGVWTPSLFDRDECRRGVYGGRRDQTRHCRRIYPQRSDGFFECLFLDSATEYGFPAPW